MGRETVNKTLEYYNQNANTFFENTKNVRVTTIQDMFLEKLCVGDIILDFGCGSGRDTKYFLERWFLVDAIDGCMELCELATKNTGIQVKQMLFDELSEVNKYDGIWACASLLHLPIEEIKTIFPKMELALKENGIIYLSFKYGDFCGERDGKHYTDMNKLLFREYFSDILSNFTIEKEWITNDNLPTRKDLKWYNIILRKL